MSECCDLSLLKTMPIMEKLFRKYNCSLPGSAPVERMFSHGGIILSKRRAQLWWQFFNATSPKNQSKILKSWRLKNDRTCF